MDFHILHIWLQSLMSTVHKIYTITINLKSSICVCIRWEDVFYLQTYSLGRNLVEITSGCKRKNFLSMNFLSALALYFYPWCHDQTMRRSPPWSPRSVPPLLCTFPRSKSANFAKSNSTYFGGENMIPGGACMINRILLQLQPVVVCGRVRRGATGKW